MAKKTIFTPEEDSILLSKESLQSALQCGRYSAERIAKEAGAEIRIGRRVLYSRKKIEEYINTNIGK